LDKAKRIVKLALSSISNEDKISMEMGQATLISFFYDIASNKDIWKYIPVYFSKNDLEILSQEFIYVLGHEGYIELIDEFNKKYITLHSSWTICRRYSFSFFLKFWRI